MEEIKFKIVKLIKQHAKDSEDFLSCRLMMEHLGFAYQGVFPCDKVQNDILQFTGAGGFGFFDPRFSSRVKEEVTV